VIALPLVRWQSSCLSWLIRPTARLKPSGSTPAASHLPPRERARLHGVAVLLPRWQSSCLSLASRTSCLHTLHFCRGTAALSRLSALDVLHLFPVATWNTGSASSAQLLSPHLNAILRPVETQHATHWRRCQSIVGGIVVFSVCRGFSGPGSFHPAADLHSLRGPLGLPCLAGQARHGDDSGPLPR